MTDDRARRSAPPAAPARADATDRVLAAWAATLERVMDRAAHEVRNVLNGLAVNVEVARSRVRRDGIEPSTLVPFVDAASQQGELVVARVEALMALGRAPRTPLDVAGLCRSLSTLLGPTAPGGLDLECAGDAIAPPTANAVAVRTAVTELALAVCESGGGTMRIEAGETGVVVRAGSVRSRPLESAVSAALAASGVRVDAQGDTITVTIGAAGAGATTSDVS